MKQLHILMTGMLFLNCCVCGFFFFLSRVIQYLLTHQLRFTWYFHREIQIQNIHIQTYLIPFEDDTICGSEGKNLKCMHLANLNMNRGCTQESSSGNARVVQSRV